MEHKVTLTYTTMDDGVYLQCLCGWEKNIGFEATPTIAVSVELEHLTEVMTQTYKEIRSKNASS